MVISSHASHSFSFCSSSRSVVPFGFRISGFGFHLHFRIRVSKTLFRIDHTANHLLDLFYFGEAFEFLAIKNLFVVDENLI